MDKHPNYYAIVPYEVLDDKNINPRQRLLLIRISSFLNNKGEFYASNKYLAELEGVTERAISLNINVLIKEGYLQSTMKNTAKGTMRYLQWGYGRKVLEGGGRKVLPISISNNKDIVGNENISHAESLLNIDKEKLIVNEIEALVLLNFKALLKCPKSIGGKKVNIEEMGEIIKYWKQYNETHGLYLSQGKKSASNTNVQFTAKACQGLVYHLRHQSDWFNIEDWDVMLDDMHDTQYHIENNFKHLTPEFVFREDKVQQYYTIKTND